MKNLSLLFFAFLLLISCSQESEAENPLANLQIDTKEFETLSGLWNLEKIELLNSGDTLISPSSVTINFFFNNDSEDIFRLNGIVSCDLYGGKLLSLNKSSISIGELHSTDMLCSNELNAFKEEYLAALFGTDEYKLEEGKLKLRSENEVLIFIR